MSELLFDKPFNSTERSNTVNCQLSAEVELVRGDAEVLGEVAKLKTAFFEQNDCLCHGDLAIDNVMVTGDQFRVWSVCREMKRERERDGGERDLIHILVSLTDH